jgi:hypothetical protein
MQDTESEQQILRLLYHAQFDLAAPEHADLQQWARTENIGENALQEIVASLLKRELILATGEMLSCRLSARGVFWVEDSGLAPTHSATHHFAVRLAILEALSLFASNQEAAASDAALASRASLLLVDCRRNLPVLADAGWARINPDGRIEITVKGLQTLHEWRKDVRASVAGNLLQA